MADKASVLFLCVHNSGRSQMAEALLKAASDRFTVSSAGLEPKPIRPEIIATMREIGIDLSHKESNSVFEFFREGRLYDYVITVCDETVEDKCPIFAGITKRLKWPFPDPEKLSGTQEERAQAMRSIRDNIQKKIENWLQAMDDI